MDMDTCATGMQFYFSARTNYPNFFFGLFFEARFSIFHFGRSEKNAKTSQNELLKKNSCMGGSRISHGTPMYMYEVRSAGS